jgi:hypothetical protein
VPTAGAISALDLVVASLPASPTARDERLSLYSRESSGTPRELMGPREYVPAAGVGPVAAGDVDGDGANELVVADTGTAELEILEYDPLTGLSSGGTYAIGGVADLVEVADVILDASGRPEIAVVDRGLGLLGLYRITDTGIVSVAGPTGIGNGVSSLASGDVTGTAAADLVVTAGDDDQFRVFTESGGGLTAGGPYATRAGPRGASVGDAWAAGTKDEIVIVNSGETTGTVSVYRGDGLSLGHFDDNAPAGAVAYDSVVADVLPGTTASGTSGEEVAVVFRSPDGTSGVEVYPQTAGGGLGAPLSYTTGARYNSGTIAAGDVDDDGRAELVVGSGGLWSRDSSATAPSSMIGRANAAGTAIGAWETLWLGGSELAGEPPAVILADLGGVLPSRHPLGAVPDTHVSTETAPVARHVECVDCHDVHAANDTTATAPAAYGVIEGTWGVTITPVSTTTITYTEQQGVEEEYQLCLGCHSGWAVLDGSRNIAFEINPLNPGEHAVVETSTDVQATSGSFVAGWDTDSILYCVDCHGNSRSTETTGPHVSPDGPLLKDPYLGRRPNASDLLCYGCHKDSVYYTGVGDGVAASTSRFYGGSLALDRRKLHRFHSNSLDIGCAACHVGHGSRELPHLLRGDVGYSHAASGGSCANACHVGGARNSYTYP